MLLILFCIYASLAEFTVFDDLARPPVTNFKLWQTLQLKDHRDRQPVQRPKEWSNFTIQIFSENITGIQLTSINPYNPIIHPYYGATILLYEMDEDLTFDFSLIWWQQPWTLYIGFVF